jgi:ketosteroid isomerase-like protein
MPEEIMDTQILLRRFADAVQNRDGADFAALFTEDAVYHDVFYGAFHGRQKIAELVNDWFYRTAEDFRWHLYDPVSNGKTLYARYTFSYKSLLPEAQGKRVMFEGVAIFTLRDGQIADYREVANTGPALLDLGFPAERVAKILGKAGAELKNRAEAQPHLT